MVNKKTISIVFIILILSSIHWNCHSIKLSNEDKNYDKTDGFGIKFKEVYKNVPFYHIDTCMISTLKVLIDNCNLDSSLNKNPYGFLLYSSKKNESNIIIVNPLDISPFYDYNFYGVFKLDNKMFYCIGSKPENMFNDIIDSLKITYRIRNLKTKKDSINTHKGIGRFDDLNTIFIEKAIKCSNNNYYFMMQPCSNILKPK
ncbi:MAG: hypothetical protein Q8880_09255 [Bacteroidota bacterium]|nr:hypothetical protein [Bacteroidota bacterium]